MPPLAPPIGFSTPSARALVRKAFERIEEPVQGLSSRQIFDRMQRHCKAHPPSQESIAEVPRTSGILARTKAASIPPRIPSTPVVDSLNHLKTVVLPDMVERFEIKKRMVRRGVKDEENGGRVDIVSSTPPQRFPSQTVINFEEYLWFLHEATPEQQKRVSDMPPIRRPQTLGTGHNLESRQKRARQQGHSPSRMETPEDFTGEQERTRAISHGEPAPKSKARSKSTFGLRPKTEEGVLPQQNPRQNPSPRDI